MAAKEVTLIHVDIIMYEVTLMHVDIMIMCYDVAMQARVNVGSYDHTLPIMVDR